MDSVNDSVTNHTGFPIRKSPVITVHITLPTLIADSTSFIASDCQGIHRVRLVAYLTTRRCFFRFIIVLRKFERSRTTLVVQCFNFQLDPDF